MKRPCYLVEAFSARPLAGNTAAVVLDGAALDARTMQQIAAELKHSETAFPLPAREPFEALQLRWFTPAGEVAFCGHATLAAFHALVEEAGRLRVPEGEVTKVPFTCKGGKLHAELWREGGRLRVLVETPATRFEPLRLPVEAVTALGLVPEALDPGIAPRRSTVLEGNLYLAVRDRFALSRARPDGPALERLAGSLGISGFAVYALHPEAGVDAALRCFFPGDGILEDPVTGSASGHLGALIHALSPGPLPRKLLVTQGDELGRPGAVEVEVRPGPQGERAWIGGRAVTVLRGELDL